jgi:hypothetical protein
MLPGEARFDLAPAVVAAPPVIAAPKSIAVATVVLAPRVSEHPAPPGRVILRL